MTLTTYTSAGAATSQTIAATDLHEAAIGVASGPSATPTVRRRRRYSLAPRFTRKPGSDSSLSSVPPVCPRPRPDSCACGGPGTRPPSWCNRVGPHASCRSTTPAPAPRMPSRPGDVRVRVEEGQRSQPTDITRFDATTFTWRGGSNAVDNPTVRVERRVGKRLHPVEKQVVIVEELALALALHAQQHDGRKRDRADDKREGEAATPCATPSKG